MKREDKDLLIAFLCASIPYHLKVQYRDSKAVDLTDYVRSVRFADCKPYLRPLSSMTEEERKQYKKIAPGLLIDDRIRLPNVNQVVWLLQNHFDFRELIPKGLAIEVTVENNPYKYPYK